MKKNIVTIFIVELLLLFGACSFFPVRAKVLPRFQKKNTTVPTRQSASYNTLVISPRFLPAHNGLVISFYGLSYAQNISYTLTYTTLGKQEGVTGSINPPYPSSSTSRTLLFGTCSSGTCVQHKKISNMRLIITSKLTSGKTSIKKYRIRL